ncbi:MAG: hypothetical protein V1735_04440 [Nanoarchaeota archaeon]
MAIITFDNEANPPKTSPRSLGISAILPHAVYKPVFFKSVCDVVFDAFQGQHAQVSGATPEQYFRSYGLTTYPLATLRGKSTGGRYEKCPDLAYVKMARPTFNGWNTMVIVEPDDDIEPWREFYAQFLLSQGFIEGVEQRINHRIPLEQSLRGAVPLPNETVEVRRIVQKPGQGSPPIPSRRRAR